MEKTSNPLGETGIVSLLLEAGNADTVYRDLYLSRAREYLSSVLPVRDYLRLKAEKAEIEQLLKLCCASVESGDWQRVRQLSDTIRMRKEDVEKRRFLVTLGAGTYDPPDVLLDPFSPGMQGFFVGQGQTPEEIRVRLVESLSSLEKEDGKWKDFYAGRRERFQSGSFSSVDPLKDDEEFDPSMIRREALSAAEHGNVDRLETLAKKMLDRRVLHAKNSTRPIDIRPKEGTLSVPFPSESLDRAGDLGLVPMHLPPAVEIGEYITHVAWQPTIQEHPVGEEEWIHIHGHPGEHPVSPEITRRLKDVVYLLMHSPFINSAGARYLPRLEEEDILVEGFPEGGERKDKSILLSSLNLPRRYGLSRLEIERALLERGPEVVGERIGLDPRLYRLVCIPPDVYTRLGPELGWGKEMGWTHFDGYQVLKGGKLRALVGGDIRFGGIFDLCSISRIDRREGVVVRFALVYRERLG